MRDIEKLVIIGSGPAGFSAAIYASRGNLNPLIITGQTFGGQPMMTTDVEDYPGFPEGILGPELMQKFFNQATKFGTRILSEDVISVNFKKTPFEIKTDNSTVLAKAVIIATGASARWLGLPHEMELVGHGVSACAVCDGPFFKGKKVAVVGGGDTALREAQHLSKFAESVALIHRRGTFRAQVALQKQIKEKDNISLIFNTVVKEILGTGKLERVKVENIVSKEESKIDLDGLFVAIGHEPNTKFLKGQISLDGNGYIVVKDKTKTSVSGVFVAGDVADPRYRQIITAAGSGAQAALDVEEYLEKQNT